MSCIITSRFKERAGEEQRRESEGARGGLKGGGGGACMCLLRAGVSRETDWRSISSPVPGKALSQEGSDTINPL